MSHNNGSTHGDRVGCICIRLVNKTFRFIIKCKKTIKENVYVFKETELSRLQLCTFEKEPILFWSAKFFVKIFGIVHLERLEGRSWKFHLEFYDL